MDKKIFQKLTKYEDDKRFLEKLYRDDVAKGKCEEEKSLQFQSEESCRLFELSIPLYIKQGISGTPGGAKDAAIDVDQADEGSQGSNNSEESCMGGGIPFYEKLKQVLDAITQELDLYENLKDLKKQKNKIKRLP